MNPGFGIELHVTDASRDQRLIERILHLRPAGQKPGFVEFIVDGGSLMLWEETPCGCGMQNPRGLGVETVIGVGDLKSVRDRAVAAGCRTSPASWKSWGRLECSFWLPDGHQLRLFEIPQTNGDETR